MSFLSDACDAVAAFLPDVPKAVEEDFSATVKKIHSCVDAGGKILIFGNGGSAADAQHFAAELVSSLHGSPFPRPVAAVALTTDTSILTAIGNDADFERIFERQVEALGRKGDVAIGLSTSGSSKNVLRGLEKAQEMGLGSVAICGSNGLARKCADVEVRLPSDSTQVTQTLTLIVIHALCESLETKRV